MSRKTTDSFRLLRSISTPTEIAPLTPINCTVMLMAAFFLAGEGDATVRFYEMSPWSYTRVHVRSQRKHGPVGVRDGSATELWFLGVCGFRRAGQRVESESNAITRCRVQAQEFLSTTILSDFCKFIELHVRAFFRNFTFFFEI